MICNLHYDIANRRHNITIKTYTSGITRQPSERDVRHMHAATRMMQLYTIDNGLLPITARDSHHMICAHIAKNTANIR